MKNCKIPKKADGACTYCKVDFDFSILFGFNNLHRRGKHAHYVSYQSVT